MTNAFIKNGQAMELIEIPAAAFTQMFFDVQLLAQMHKDLIGMYEKESALKKHHKAYLHVRDAANEMCRMDKQAVDLILDHYNNPDRYMNQAICFHEHMIEKYENPSEKCDREQHIPSEKCDEGRKQDAVRRESAEDMDAFDLPHGMVMMSTGTLGTMQDDMLALAYAVDQLVDAFNDIAEGGGYDRNKMNIITGSASDLARDVFNRWDDAEMAVLS